MEKIWLKSYPEGIPAEIDPVDDITLVDKFKKACEKFSDKPAFYNFGHTLTYRELFVQSQAFASFLQQILKLEKGSRVAVMMPNILQYPIVMMGILQAGCVVVNVNPLYTSSELSYQLQDAVAETIVVLANFADTLERALPKTRVKNIIVTEVGDCLSLAKKISINFILKYLKKQVPCVKFSYKKLTACLNKVKKQTFTPVNISSEDMAFLQYTGGTTGVSKGAILTHGNVVSHIQQIKLWIKSTLQEGKEIIITALPLYHIFSLTANCFTFIEMGGLNVLITNPRDIPAFIKILRKIPFTVITGVNTLFNALMNSAQFTHVNFTKLHLALGGGMAISPGVSRRWKTLTGVPLLEAYGLTEASPGVTIDPLNLEIYNGSVGLPFPSTEISIRNEQDEEVKLGEMGELCIKGPQVMKAYWHNPEETTHVFTKDGWLRTGDIVKMDEKGFLYIVDRKKDMIIVSGFNVYPHEVENVISSHPGVLEVGVVGESDEVTGEIVKAVIVKKDPTLSAEEIIRYCRQHLTGYKIPRKIEFRDSLPKSNVGKILRRMLK